MKASTRKPRYTPMSEQTLLRVIAKMLIPFILIFGIYVQTHGEVGPGGGFQAGVILAAAFILYGLVFGANVLKQKIPPFITDVGMALGALLYAGTGLHNLIAGGNFLDYGMLDRTEAGGAEVLGMVLVEYGVGITVCCVMITIYTQITARPERLSKDEQAELDATLATIEKLEEMAKMPKAGGRA